MSKETDYENLLTTLFGEDNEQIKMATIALGVASVTNKCSLAGSIGMWFLVLSERLADTNAKLNKLTEELASLKGRVAGMEKSNGSKTK